MAAHTPPTPTLPRPALILLMLVACTSPLLGGAWAASGRANITCDTSGNLRISANEPAGAVYVEGVAVASELSELRAALAAANQAATANSNETTALAAAVGRLNTLYGGLAARMSAVEKALFARPPCAPRTTRTVIQFPPGTANIRKTSAVAVDPTGRAHVCYRDERTYLSNIYSCIDSACTQATTLTLVQGLSTGISPAVAFDARGLPVITHAQTDGGDLTNLLFSFCSSVASSGDNICAAYTTRALSTTTAGTRVVRCRDSAVAVDSAGIPFVAFEDLDLGALGFTVCADAECSSSSARILSTEAVRGPPQIAVAPSGLPVVAFQSRADGLTKLLLCSDRMCAGPITTVPLDAPASSTTATWLSMHLLPSGAPSVALASSAGQAMLYVCDSPACSSATSTTLGTAVTGSPGRTIAHAIAGADAPTAAFVASGGKSIVLAQCPDAQCLGGASVLANPTTALGHTLSYMDTAAAGPTLAVSFFDETDLAIKLML